MSHEDGPPGPAKPGREDAPPAHRKDGHPGPAKPGREDAPPAHRWWIRGAIWIAVGALAHVIGYLAGYPLVMRGTGWPWGFVVAGVGVLLLGWDFWRARAKR